MGPKFLTPYCPVIHITAKSFLVIPPCKSALEHQIQNLNSGYFIQLGLFLDILGSGADLWPFYHF